MDNQSLYEIKKDYGFLICNKCGNYYQLQEGESSDDFESCHCGGRLIYTRDDPMKLQMKKSPYMDTGEEAQQKIIEAVDKVVNHENGDNTKKYNGRKKHLSIP